MQSSNPNLIEAKMLLLELDKEILEGRGDSDYATSLRDRLDPVFCALSILGREELERDMLGVFNRVQEARVNGNSDVLISTAIALPDKLLVYSCSLERIEISSKKLCYLVGIEASNYKNYTISNDCAHISWPKDNIHLSIGSIKILANGTLGNDI